MRRFACGKVAAELELLPVVDGMDAAADDRGRRSGRSGRRHRGRTGARTACRGAGRLSWLVGHFCIDGPRFIAIPGRCAPCLLNSKTLLRVSHVCSMFGSAVSRPDGDRSDLAAEMMRLAISQPQLDAQFGRKRSCSLPVENWLNSRLNCTAVASQNFLIEG